MMQSQETSPTEGPSIKRSPETIELLLTRSSMKAAVHSEPGPGPDDLDVILRCATRVPDHGRLTPWRILVVQGEAREELGSIFESIYRSNHPDATEENIAFEHRRPLRSPLVLVVSTKIESVERIPRWEQVLSGAAVCQNILIASTALGYACQWLSGWAAEDEAVKAALHIAPGDQILGFIYIGTASTKPDDRPRPALDAVVDYF